MQKNLVILALVIIALLAGTWFGRSSIPVNDAAGPAGTDGSAREILYWVAPMDPNFRRDAPGKSPMGMDLVPVYADEVDARPGTVKIEPAILANFGVRVAEARRSSLPRVVDTVGYVTYDEDSLEHVHTRVDGWIETLSVSATGDPVGQGEFLFDLYSPELVNAQEELLIAIGSGSEALREASMERLAALGMSRAEIDRLVRDREVRQRIRYYAPQDGVVTSLGVREGMYVTPTAEIMSIASLDEIWVVAEILERQATWLEPGQPATVTLDSMPGDAYTGEVDYIYPELDPVTRTLRLRLRFANPAAGLRPNMYARVRIEGRETGPVVHVPKEAVIRGGDLDRVVVALGNGRFRSTPVKLGIESGDRVAIRDGLEAGTPVVVSGQFLIDSESNIGGALERLEGGARGREKSGPPTGQESMEHDAGENAPTGDGGINHGTMDHGAGDAVDDGSLHQ